MFVDPLGLDAILINKHIDGGEWYQDVGNAVGIEHMSGFFQDGNGVWWYFFYGDRVEHVEVTDASIFDSMDSMNTWIKNNTKFNGENPYMTSVYVKGDFTASNNDAAELFESYNDSYGVGNNNGDYNVVSNNCGQVTMRLFSKGILPDGTNVGTYVAGRGYGTGGEFPDIHMNNMQRIFYNKAHNLPGFNSAMQVQRNKYEGWNAFTQWWYRNLIKDINTIS